MELTKDLRKILDLGITLTSEKEYSRLLEKILSESMEITNSDAGTIYIRVPDGLKFMIMQNKTMNSYQGGRGEAVNLPNVPLKEENICAYSALHRKIVNIEDVYCSHEFDFKGPINYDKITEYRTQSMLVIPLENHEGENLGVIQLINATDDLGQVIPYHPKYEYIVFSLASQAAVSLDNLKHLEDMKDLINSMVFAFTTAIDERTPYNANHTKNVAHYTEQFVDYLNQCYKDRRTFLHFDENMKEQLTMAAYLHDVGKLVIPLEIMDKATRLDTKLPSMLSRLELIRAWFRIDYLEERLNQESYEREICYLDETVCFLHEVDRMSYLSEETLLRIENLEQKKYRDSDGVLHSYITRQEAECMRIRKGTLTAGEREIIETHVDKTAKILAKIPFGALYQEVPKLAAQHHEYLDGSGYPKHLTDKDLSNESRILVIIDIYDSLVTTDRPYKRPMPKEDAFVILNEMVAEGKLDGYIVEMWEHFLDEKEKAYGRS